MTVSTLATRVFYAGDGVSITFAVPFPFLSRTHLRATRFRVGVAPETLTIVSATGEGNPAGGSVTLSGPVGSAWSLLIERDTPETQETDYTPNDAFPAETHERGLDKLTMLIQELRTEMDRAVRFPPEDQRDGALPSSSTRANGYLGFGPDGSPIIVPSVPVGGGSGRFSLGTRKTVSATAATYDVTAADGNWVTVNIAPGVGMPTGGTINLPGAAAGLPVGYTVMIQLYSSTGLYPSSGQIEVNAAGFREWFFSFTPNLSPMLAAEFVWDGTAWAPLSPYNDRIEGLQTQIDGLTSDFADFLPKAAGASNALTGDLYFEPLPSADDQVYGRDLYNIETIFSPGGDQYSPGLAVPNGRILRLQNYRPDLGHTRGMLLEFTPYRTTGFDAHDQFRVRCHHRSQDVLLYRSDTDAFTLDATDIILDGTGGSVRLNGNFGFGVAPISKPTVTGSRGGNAALASLLTALANYGLITNSTTA